MSKSTTKQFQPPPRFSLRSSKAAVANDLSSWANEILAFGVLTRRAEYLAGNADFYQELQTILDDLTRRYDNIWDIYHWLMPTASRDRKTAELLLELSNARFSLLNKLNLFAPDPFQDVPFEPLPPFSFQPAWRAV